MGIYSNIEVVGYRNSPVISYENCSFPELPVYVSDSNDSLISFELTPKE